MNYLSFYLLSIISAGAIAWIIAKMLFGRMQPSTQRTVQIILFFIIFGGFRAFALPIFTEEKETNALETTLLEYPIFAAIKHSEPQTFKYIISEINDLQKQGQVSTYAVAQQKIQPIFMQRLLATSNDNILAFTKLNQRLLERLNQDKKFKQCASFATGEQQDIKERYDILTAEENQQHLDMMEVIFLDDTQMTVPPKSLIEPIIEDTLVNVLSRPEQDYTWLFTKNFHNQKQANLKQENQNNQQICQLSIDVNRELLSLPKHQAAAVLRYLYSNQSLNIQRKTSKEYTQIYSFEG